MPEDDPNTAPRPDDGAFRPRSAVEESAAAGVFDPTAAKPPAPVNKLHEWAAAVVITAFLAAILAGFLFFLRRTSL